MLDSGPYRSGSVTGEEVGRRQAGDEGQNASKWAGVVLLLVQIACPVSDLLPPLSDGFPLIPRIFP
jgi:hypothetical protein